MLYHIVSIIANLAGSIYAGIQFARIFKAIKDGKAQEKNIEFWFCQALCCFAIPFFWPMSHLLGKSVGIFFGVTSLTTLFAIRSMK